MNQPDIPKKSSEGQLQEIICLFDDEFSIDWVMALTDQKPSQVLLALERAIQEGWLEQTDIGRFSVSDPKKKEQVQFIMDTGEKEYLFQKITRFFLDEYPENDFEITKISKLLLKITNDEVGCRGLLLAGDAFVKNYQPDKALECYAKLKLDLSRLEGEAVDDLFIEMAIKFSKVSTARQSTIEVVQTLKDAMERALKKNDKASQALIHMHIAKNEWLLNRYDRALKTFRKGWVLANRCNDAKLMRSAISFRTFFSFWQGRFKEVISHYENSLSEVEKYPREGFPLLVTITVGQCYTYVGQITQGLGMLDAMQASCREAGDMHTAAFAIASINTALLMIQSVDETLAYVEETYSDIQQSGNQYIELLTQGSLAYLYYLKGDIPRSVAFLKKFVEKCRNVNVDTLHHRPYVLDLCWAMEQGLYPQILDLSLEKEVKNLMAGQNVYLKGLAYRYKALLEIRNQQPAPVIMKSLATSLRWLEESGHEFEIIETRLAILRQVLKMDDQDKVREMVLQIGRVISQYKEEILPSDLKSLFKGTPSGESFSKEILKLGREIMSVSDGKELIHRIISTGNQLTGAERGAIFLFNENKKEASGTPALTLRASKNLTHEQVAHPGFEPSMKLIQETATASGSDQKVRIANDPAPAGRFKTLSGDVIRSRICVPMIFRGKVTGVLYHDNRLLNSVFQETDLEWLSFFAAQAAIALDNLSAHEEISRLNQKIREETTYTEEQYFPSARFKDIIGKSDAVHQMLFLVEQVAGTDTHVLISGETGVGKELVANAVHYQSPRRDKPFIKANCSALTETLINSELFGHERGAFTGANSRRLGRFELADGGTIFLDEIGDLPLSVQVNLLRVLQNNEFERVGGNETIRSNFRLIAATNHNLSQLVKEKKFRADLYFRLNVFPIQVPPLRDRKEDIPLLVHHFIRRFCRKMNKDIKTIPSAEMNKMIQYHWPGNIRELENIIERGLVLNSTPVFKAMELDADIDPGKNKIPARSLEENERNHILLALEQKSWKVRGPGGVAEFLDIHPSTLTARMKKLGIKREGKNG
ncbi:MAG: sigma 54-interacting transcriptional regulator [Proteobacteria bacterium]|nr:sigma 54-interacting transcriptional regulator [Pseudomonadota bacterium]MBU4471337.1 sigma 54-interacting transcriptional regulator [Pseudomonadota bacterium]MCG2751660.1 sigma 54-interacting transcriptional regulator [Desulfobacteraceae bacterium]